MARYDFGGTLADFVVTSRRLGGLDVLGLSAASLTFWSAQTGGTRYTDLQLNGSVTSSISVGADGQVPTFQGPDTVTAMWVDGGAGRTRIVAQGIPGPAGPGATNADIADYLGTPGATQTAADARYATIVKVAGTQNISATLQAKFDGGDTKIRLQGGGTAVLNAGVFLDATSTNIGYVVEGDGNTTLKLNAGLPTTAAYTPDSTTGWAFHVNTLRSALSGNVVTHSDATRSTGAGFPATARLTFRNIIFDGAGLNAGYVFGNTAAAVFENCVYRNVKRLLSWRGYADGNGIRGGQVISPATGGWLIDQIANGDAVEVSHLKGEETGVWRAQNCNGGKVTDSLNGNFSWSKCRGIRVSAHHTEADRVFADNLPMFNVDCSSVTFDSPFFYSAHVGNRYPIQINDTDAENHSDVEVRNPEFVNYLATTPDSVKLADIYIQAMSSSSRLRVTGPSGTVSVSTGGNSALHSRDGILVDSAVTAVATALAAARSTLAGTSWVLRKRGTAWEVINPGSAGGLRAGRVLTSPSISSVSSAAITSTLTAGTMEYAIALRDADGNYTAASAASSVSTIDSQTNLVLATIDTTPATLVIWRKAGTGVLATPDAYAEVPVDGQLVRLHDTGTYVNGRAWVTTSVPVPSTVAATNTTYDRIVLPSGVQVGMGNGSPEGRIGALTGALWLRADGDAYTSLYRKTTSGGNNGWRNQRDNPGTVLANLSYRPGTSTLLDTTSTSFVDADAANLLISFVAPSTGKVTVRLTADCAAVTASSDFYWNLRDSVGDVANTDMHMGFSTSPARLTYEVIIGSLTSGTTYTWKWGHKAGNAANASRIRCGSTNGPATMTVLAAA